jgi:acyl-coenzyme A synthetase/AMP-(fatty) acid ligase
MTDSRAIRTLIAADPAIGAGNYLFQLKRHLGSVDPVLLDSDRPLRLGKRVVGPVLRLGEILQISGGLATWYLGRGIGPKDPVAVYVEDGLGYYFHFIALTRIGAIPALVNSQLDPALVHKYIARIGAAAIVTDHKTGPAFRGIGSMDVPILDAHEMTVEAEPPSEPFEHAPDDPVMICHTSGTTGIPKAVPFNHSGFFYGVRQQITHELGARTLSALPHSHGAAHTMFMSCALRLMPVRVQGARDADSVVAAIERFQPDLVLAFPKVYVDMCRLKLEDHDLSSVARWLSTGDASHEPHIRRLVRYGSHEADGKRRAGSLYVDNLGSSEFAFGIMRNIHSADTNRYDRCVGRPFEWVDVKVFDDTGKFAGPGVTGRLGVCSPSVTAGYWNDSALTAKTCHRGYWLTGDLVYYDEHGRYYHVDRTPDRILCANRLVYSTQAEELILKYFPDIFDCTIVEYSDGEEPGLAIAVELIDGNVDISQLRECVASFILSRDLPSLRKFRVVGRDWNEGVTGKKLKRLIRMEVKGLEC